MKMPPPIKTEAKGAPFIGHIPPLYVVRTYVFHKWGFDGFYEATFGQVIKVEFKGV